MARKQSKQSKEKSHEQQEQVETTAEAKAEEKAPEKVGLELLDDETLAEIVNCAVANEGGETSRWPQEANDAFLELSKRTSRYRY